MKLCHITIAIAVCAMSPLLRAQTPNCDNLMALHFARATGLVDCDVDMFQMLGNACHDRTANDCAEIMLLNPHPAGPSGGNLEYAYTWLCPSGGIACADTSRLKCVDGTRPAFYYHAPSPASNDWIFYFSGGGGCIGDLCATQYITGEQGEMTTCHGGQTCVQTEQATLGDHLTGNGILSSNPAQSRFAGWNRVRFDKCTYDAFRGNAVEVGILDGVDVVQEVFHHGKRQLIHTFNQLAVGALPSPPPLLSQAERILLIGNSGGGKSLMLTGDEFRAHLATLAPSAKIRLLIDAHDLPMIQTEALYNLTHIPAPPATAVTVFDVPWGGMGTLPVGDTPAAPYDQHMFESMPPPPGRAWEYNDAWGASMDASCRIRHGNDAPECHDEMHVLWNHVTTPFLVHMSLDDSVWRDGGAIFSESAYDWNDQDFADRIYTQTENLITSYATDSELATGADTSGTSGSDMNDLQPASWNRSVFVPNCGGAGSHTPLSRDDNYQEHSIARCLGQTCSLYNTELVLGDWLDYGLGHPALDGYVDADGWTWSTSACSPLPCNSDGSCQMQETSCTCPSDCGPPPLTEANCTDGLDNDCDGLQDCNDDDCPACSCLADSECDDANACTEDRCIAGFCEHPPSSAAGPVAATLSMDVVAGGAQISWAGLVGFASYNTYRGTIIGAPLAYDHVCFEAGDQFGDGATTTIDAALPPDGEAFYYLVSSKDACGESTPGRASDGTDRIPVTVCP